MKIFLIAVLTINFLILPACATEEIKQLSNEEYESFLSSQIVTYEPSVNLGPVAFKIGNVSGENLSMDIRLAKIPNLTFIGSYLVSLKISHVFDQKNTDILDLGTFQNDYFRRINFDLSLFSPNFYEGHNIVALISQIKKEEIKSIEGEVILNLPIDIQKVRLTPELVGQLKKIGNFEITLSQIENNKITFQYNGLLKYLVGILAYGTDNQPLHWQSNNEFSNNISYQFDNNIQYVDLLIANTTLEKSYPFKVGY